MALTFLKIKLESFKENKFVGFQRECRKEKRTYLNAPLLNTLSFVNRVSKDMKHYFICKISLASYT